MEENTRSDIRRLLKTFGIQADEAIMAHLALTSGEEAIQVRLTLEDLTNYDENPPKKPLHLEIEGEIRR